MIFCIINIKSHYIISLMEPVSDRKILFSRLLYLYFTHSSGYFFIAFVQT